MAKENSERIVIRFPDEVKTQIKKYAREQGVSPEQFIVNCVTEKITDIEWYKENLKGE